ncbi:centrosomal protein of 290 kDa-like isoform X4 [Centruroides sculpturatus]|uniref:centrosomal protein of 290 kDa-like isoform X4 n=1 Tax=Centruroides sculpturatus TaxID=218467 RepID=UPI000C6CC66C|nr:centrosomal protein of 290 kDa-like isoform X4 [Centruroides sculpturatus]
MQAEVAMEEMVQMAEKQGISDGQRERELLEQINDLKYQLESQKSLSENSYTKQLQEEIVDLEKENNILRNKLQDNQEEILGLTNNVKKEKELVKQLQRENSDLKYDIQQFKEELSEGCQKIEQLQEVTETKSTDTYKDLTQKLYEKNQQINKLFDEVKEFENRNENLQQQVNNLQEKLEDAVQQIEKMTNEYIKLKEMFHQSQAAVHELKKERDYYKNEVANFSQQESFKDDSDDQILITVSKRVQEWKEILRKKEEEILHYQDLVKKLQSQMISFKLDGDHATVAILSKALEEKDRQLNSLKQQLARATKDIEESTEIIENLKLQLEDGKDDNKNRQSDKVALLQNSLHETAHALELTQEMLVEIEEETKKKDKALNEALNRMRQYEMGQYGLADAVTEIKECKSMIRIRDKQIEDLIQQINLAEIEISDLSDENEFLRKKLGLDSQRSQELSRNYKSPKQKEAALILSLQQQIESLEEERVQLKQQLREKNDKKQKQSPPVQSPLIQSPKKKENALQSPRHKEDKLLVSELQSDNHKLREAIENLTTENQKLQIGLKDISEYLKELDGKKLMYNSEELEKLIKETIQNTALSVNTTVDIAKNEEVNTELSDKDEKSLSEAQPLSSPQIKNDISVLNNDMIEILKEYSSLETDYAVDEELEKVEKQLPLNKQQIALLYKQFLEEKSQYEAEKQKWMQEKKELEERNEIDQIKLEEFQHLMDTLSQDESEIKCRLAEIVRQITTLRVNETTLSRKVNILQDIETEIKKENIKLKQEHDNIEIAASKKIGSLQRFKDLAKYKIKALISALEESVPLEEVEKVNKQYMELAIKYNNMLEKELSMSNMEKEQMQMINNWENENKTLLDILKNERKKVHLLEETIKKNLGENSLRENSENSDLNSLSDQLATLEIKELNERQKADHLQQLYEQQKQLIQRLEDRNDELNNKVSKLMQESLDKVVMNGKLIEITDMNDSENDKKKLKELEQSKMKLQIEISKLKEIAEVAHHQLKSIQRYKISQNEELKILQKQFFDLQCSSDEKMALGKLYRQILQLQLNEASIIDQLETSKKKIMKVEAECLQLMNRCENKEEAIYTLHNKFLNKFCFLMKIIRELRHEYSGSISISKLEKIHDNITHLRQEKIQILKDMQNYNEKLETAQLKQLEFENKNKILEEKLEAIKSNKFTEKMFEWHNQIESLRLNELKLNREVKKKSQEIAHQNNQISYLEKQLADLEEENIKLEKKLEDKWLHWEETEIELEMQKKDIQKTIGEFPPLPQFEQLFSGRPDHSQSEKIQLEQAVNIIKMKQASLEENQETIQALKDNISQLEKKLQEAESAILARDHAIAQLRSHISINSSMEDGLSSSLDHTEIKQMLKTAQSTVACLQARLDQKEESLSRYKELLHKAQEEAEIQKANHQKELLAMWEKLQMQQDQAISAIRQVATKMINKPSNAIANKQVARLQHLEESVIDQEREILLLSEQLGTSQKEVDKWKEEVEIVRKQRNKDQKSIEQELKDNVQALEEELNKKNQELKQNEEKISKLQAELESQKELFKPEISEKSVTLYDNLKQELADKEKQLKALSKALTELRSDMMVTVQDHLNLQKYGSSHDAAIQQIIETNTKEMQEKIKFYESQNLKLKRDLKLQTDKSSTMEKEIQSFKEDLARKLDTITKLRKENEMLQKKINKLKINIQERKMLPIESDEISKLQKKILTLEEQLKRHQQPEKPYDEVTNLTKSQEEIIRWEEGKKWQQTVERLKQRCQAKEEELESLKKTEKLLRDKINRSDREKMILENRIKNLYQKLSAENNESVIKNPVYQDLQTKATVLEKNNAELAEKLQTEKNKCISLEETNKKLLSEIEKLEKEKEKKSEIMPDYREETEHNEEEVLKLKEENLELKLQLNQLLLEMPQLQQSNNILKEKETVSSKFQIKMSLSDKKEVSEELLHSEGKTQDSDNSLHSEEVT